MKFEPDDLALLLNPVPCDDASNECPRCNGVRFLTDYRSAERVCAGCGLVCPDFAVYLPNFDHYNRPHSFFKRTASYRRPYHWNVSLSVRARSTNPEFKFVRDVLILRELNVVVADFVPCPDIPTKLTLWHSVGKNVK